MKQVTLSNLIHRACLALTLFVVGSNAALAQSADVRISDATAARGEIVEVTIAADQALQNLAAVDLAIGFDSDRLAIQSVVGGVTDAEYHVQEDQGVVRTLQILPEGADLPEGEPLLTLEILMKASATVGAQSILTILPEADGRFDFYASVPPVHGSPIHFTPHDGMITILEGDFRIEATPDFAQVRLGETAEFFLSVHIPGGDAITLSDVPEGAGIFRDITQINETLTARYLFIPRAGDEGTNNITLRAAKTLDPSIFTETQVTIHALENLFDRIIMAQGPGGTSEVQTRNLDPDRHEQLLGIVHTFRGKPPGFNQNVGGGINRGVYLSTGDVTGNGQTDVVVSYSGITSSATFPNLFYSRDAASRVVSGPPFSIFPHTIPDSFINYTIGELRTAVGDFIGAGIRQIAIAQGTGSNGVVRIVMRDPTSSSGWKIVGQFYGLADAASNITGSAYSNNADGGVTLAAGDLTGNGRDELIVGQTNSPTSNARFQVLSLPATSGDEGVVVDDDIVRFQFNALGVGLANVGNGGVNLTVGDLSGNGANEVIAASMGNSRDHGDARDSAPINLVSVRTPVITGGRLTGFTVLPGSLFNMLTPEQNPSGALSIAAGEFDGDRENGQELIVGTSAIFNYDAESMTQHAILPAPVNRFFIFKANYNEDRSAIQSITNVLQRLSDPNSLGMSNIGRQAFIDFINAEGDLVEMNPSSGALNVASGSFF